MAPGTAATHALPVPKPRSDPLETRLDALYATPPAGFVALRNALAQELAREHDPRADEVRRLPRPTVPVWALNFAARSEPDRIKALLAGADAVIKAHRLALGGARRDVLREANQALATALERATSSATRLAGVSGHPLSSSMLGRVRATLRALAFGSPEARGRLRAGRVLAESSDTGVDTLKSLSPLPADPRAGTRESTPARKRQMKERERALAVARREATAAEEHFATAASTAVRARQEAEEAQRRADEMRERTRDAERELQVAGRQRDEARRRLVDLGFGSDQPHPP
jgi:hypothetical protein